MTYQSIRIRPSRGAWAAWPAAMVAWMTAVAAYGQTPAPAPPFGAPAAPQVISADGKFTYRGRFNGGRGQMEVVGPITSTGIGYAKQSGVQLSADLSHQGAFGYAPIFFTATLLKPTQTDKRIRIHFEAGDWNEQRAIAVEQTFVLPSGATSASTRLLVPKFQEWQFGKWEVSVDGRIDEELSASLPGLPPGSGTTGEIMVLTTATTINKNPGLESGLQTSVGGVAIGLRAVAEVDLPTDWLEYTLIDLFVLPAAELPVLVEKHPAQARALLRWVRSGGTLWLDGAGGRWERIPEAEKALGFEASDDVDADGITLDRNWISPSIGNRSNTLADGAVELSTTDSTTDEQSEPTSAAIIQGVRSWIGGEGLRSSSIVVRRYGMGIVTAFRSPLQNLSFTGQVMPAGDIPQSLVMPRLTWPSRHGNRPDNPNHDFNNLLIPGVGMAPVVQFQILLSLFVIGIGPLNYWLFKRKNNLPMLLVTVPVASVLTTSLLFSYGILADGFETRVRVRSLTVLDQRAKEATSWARLSYYAGIAPRDGLVLPADVAVYPISPGWDSGFYRRSQVAQRQLQWNGREQRLTQGWLASRTPTQFLAVAARASSKRLDIRPTETGLKVTNRLGVDITHLAVQDKDGRLYWGENLAAGASRVYPIAERSAIAGDVRMLFTTHLPEFPSGDEDGSVTGGPQVDMYGMSLSQNLMEAELAAINSPLVASWGDGSYIAFTKSGAEVDLGLDDAIEEASFHVIRGSW